MTYKTIEYFLRTYFHQDWMSDFESYRDVINDFVQNEAKEKIHALHCEIKSLLDENNIHEEFVFDCGGNYSPRVDGISIRDWLNEVLVKTKR